ncbi:hypothetical protein Pfo_022192 [Paulownia fortunei]|nr:hypothetical protein Pfo_022192 [Paulownia fortunei]
MSRRYLSQHSCFLVRLNMMNLFESMRVVSQRILNLYPGIDFKRIIGYALIKGYSWNEMMQLAIGPDNMIQSLVLRAEQDLLTMLAPFTLPSYPASCSSAALGANSGQWYPQVPLTHYTPSSMQFTQPRNQEEANAASSVYLNFPPQSKFSEQDVYNYFNNNFGPVKRVVIPIRERRVFGFVIFYNAESVKLVLEIGIHFICGHEVLAKPYKKKPTHIDSSAEANLPESPFGHGT